MAMDNFICFETKRNILETHIELLKLLTSEMRIGQFENK